MNVGVSTGMEKSGHCGEVVVSGCSTVQKINENNVFELTCRKGWEEIQINSVVLQLSKM